MLLLPKDLKKSIFKVRVIYWGRWEMGDRQSSGFEKKLRAEKPILGEKTDSQLVRLSWGAQGNGEGKVVPKSTPAGPVDLEDGDPGGENNYPEEEAHS